LDSLRDQYICTTTFPQAYLHNHILIDSIYAYQYVVVKPLSLLAKNEGQTLKVLIKQHAAIDSPTLHAVFSSRMLWK